MTPARRSPARPELAPSRRGALRRRLLDWYDRHARDLPWRRDPRPYPVWLSEVMLQQTRVAVVEPRFRTLLERYPTIEALAGAPEEELLNAWQGLGYYGRARRMQAAARVIVERHDGRFPERVEDARALPGVGDYTAGAVLSIAHGQRLPLVDGNVARVFARLEAIDRPVEDTATKRRLWALADELVPADRPGDWNQALMELGALVCTPRAPQCGDCPVRTLCRAHEKGVTEAVPVMRPRRQAPIVHVAVAHWREGEAHVLTRRDDAGVMKGFWEQPAVDVERPAESSARLAAHLEALGVGAVRVGESLGTVHHAMFHRRTRMHVFDVRGSWTRACAARLRRIDADQLERLPLTTATVKVMDFVASRGADLFAGER